MASAFCNSVIMADQDIKGYTESCCMKIQWHAVLDTDNEAIISNRKLLESYGYPEVKVWQEKNVCAYRYQTQKYFPYYPEFDESTVGDVYSDMSQWEIAGACLTLTCNSRGVLLVAGLFGAALSVISIV